MPSKRLNAHTTSFAKWKKQTQDTFEFSVLICSAVPTLKRNIRLYEKGIITELAKPDHYGAARELNADENIRRKNQLKDVAVGYRAKLSKYILISNFSFFESYVIDVLKEMIDFHGGAEGLVKNSKARAESQIINDSTEIENIRRKVRGVSKPVHHSRCKNASNLLTKMQYRFPSDLLSGYGAKMLLQKISNLTPHDMPNLLIDGLHMRIDESLVLDFHNVREVRNRIAHGDAVNLTIEQVTNMSKTLRTIALDLDQHLLRYYFISESHLTHHSSTTPSGAS